MEIPWDRNSEPERQFFFLVFIYRANFNRLTVLRCLAVIHKLILLLDESQNFGAKKLDANPKSCLLVRSDRNGSRDFIT